MRLAKSQRLADRSEMFRFLPAIRHSALPNATLKRMMPRRSALLTSFDRLKEISVPMNFRLAEKAA